MAVGDDAPSDFAGQPSLIVCIGNVTLTIVRLGQDGIDIRSNVHRAVNGRRRGFVHPFFSAIRLLFTNGSDRNLCCNIVSAPRGF